MSELRNQKPRFIKNHFNKLINKNPKKSFNEIIKYFISISNEDLKLTEENINEISRIVDTACEIQRSFLNYSDPNSSRLILNSLAKKIISNSNISDFIKFLFVNYDLGTELHLIEEKNYHKLLYDAINELYVFTKDENAMEGIASQYSGDWHFLFELLQNARDANSDCVLLKEVKIKGKLHLLFANNGNRFTPMDVWGISSIGQGSKNRKNIGYFGIGFKSVRDFSNSSIIISKPFEFRLNLILDDKEAIEWDLQDISEEDELSEFNNRFYLEGITEENIRAFENHIHNIDQKFMLFLEPLTTINIIFDEKSYPLKVESMQTDGIPISKIEDGLYIIHTISEDLNLKDKDDKNIGEREIKIAFKFQKENKNVYSLKDQDSDNTLYAYFPVINRKPKFNFILHGHFSLINSREDLEIKENSEKWKKDINEVLLTEKAPKCFLELYDQLSSSKNDIFKELTKLVPFQTNDNKVYNLFRNGLIQKIKEISQKNQLLFWWDNDRYIPFSNIVFVDKKDKEILNFLNNNLSNKFRESLSHILNLSSFKDSVYICNELNKKMFCQEIFTDSEMIARELDTLQIMELIKKILNSDNLPVREEIDYISSNMWAGYFGSLESLKSFQEVIVKWHFFNENRFVQEEFFNYYLLILQDCSGNVYLSRINNSNFFYIIEKFTNEFQEYMNIIRIIQNNCKKNDPNLPLFLFFESLKDPNGNLNAFHEIIIKFFQEIQRANIYSSLYQLLKVIFDKSSTSRVILEDKEIISNLHQMIKRVFKNLNNKLGDSIKIREYYSLLTQNIFLKDSKEDYLISDLFSNLLKIPIFSTADALKGLFKFTDLYWGDYRYLDLLIQTSFGENLNIINQSHSEICEIIDIFLKKSQKYFIEICPESQKYFIEIYPEFRSKYISYNSINKRVSDHLDDIIDKNPTDISTFFNSGDLAQQEQNIVFIFFSNKNVFEKFSSLYYSDFTNVEEFIILSKLYNYEKYSSISSRNLTFEIQDSYIDKDVIDLLITYSKNAIGLKLNWIHRDDNKYEILSKKLHIHEVLLHILDKHLLKINEWEKWTNFYVIIQKFLENNENQITKFKQDFQKQETNVKFDNCKGELKLLNKLYLQHDSEELSKEQIKILQTFIDNPDFGSYIPSQESLELILSLQEYDLIEFSKSMSSKRFLIKVLTEFFKNENPDFFKEDNLQFFEEFLKLLKVFGFKLKELKNFCLVPNLNYNFIKVEQIPNKYYIFLSEFIEELPIYDVWEKFPEDDRKPFEDWLDPDYFRVFKSIFSEDILEIKKTDGVDYNGRDIYECFQKPQILNEDCNEEIPPFLILYIIEIYFKIEGFDIQNEKHLKYIINSLKIFKDLSFKTEKAKKFFIEHISDYIIFPALQVSDDNYKLVNLDNINLISREFQAPEFLNDFNQKRLYLHKDIENLLISFKWEFKFLNRAQKIPLKYILDNCSHLISPKNLGFFVDNHKQLINLLFQNQNFLYYYYNEKADLKLFLDKIYLKSIDSEEYFKPSKLIHPSLFKDVKLWWNNLINVKFPRNNIVNTIDLAFYNLEQLNFIKHAYKIEDVIIFTSSINIFEALEIIYRVLIEKKDHISNYLLLYQKFGENFSKVYSNFIEKEKPSKKELREKLILLLKLLMEGIRNETDIFNKFFLSIEQLNQKKFRYIIPEEKFINLDDEFFNPSHRLSKHTDDPEQKIENVIIPFFNSIENLQLDTIKEVIIKTENIFETIVALNNLLSEYSFETQKGNEAYFSLKNEITWFDKKYTLDKLFRRNSKLEISNIQIYFKDCAYFDDLLPNSEVFKSFIKFFDIEKIKYEHIIDRLKDLSLNAKFHSKNILDILILLNNKNKIHEYFAILRSLKIIPVFTLETNQKKYRSFDTLLSYNTLYSTKTLIIENIIEHWSNAQKLKETPSYLLFDNKYRKSTRDWEKLIETMLKAHVENENMKLERIDTYPDILRSSEFGAEEKEELFVNETRFFKIMLSFLVQNSSRKPFKYIKMRNTNLNSLDAPYSFERIIEAYGDIKIHTFNGREIELNNIFLRKLFKVDESNKTIYYSDDLELSDLEEHYTSHLLDSIFPNNSGDINEINEFRSIFYWRVDFTESKLTEFESNPDILRKYLEKKEIGLVSKTITDIRDSIMDFLEAILTLKDSYSEDSDIFNILQVFKSELIIEEKLNKSKFTVQVPRIRIDPEEYEDFSEQDIKELLRDFLSTFQQYKGAQKRYPYISNIHLQRFNDILSLKVPEKVKIQQITPTEPEVPTPPPVIPPEAESLEPTNLIPPESEPLTHSTPQPKRKRKKAGRVIINPPVHKFPKKTENPKKAKFTTENKKTQEKMVPKKEIIGEPRKFQDEAEELLRDIYSGTTHELGVPCQICRCYCRECKMHGNVRDDYPCTATCSLIHFNSNGLVSSRRFKLWSTKEYEQLETEIKVDLEDFFRGIMLILCHNHGLAFSGFKENIRSQIFKKCTSGKYKTLPGGDILIALKNLLFVDSDEEIPVELIFSKEHLECFKYTYEIFNKH